MIHVLDIAIIPTVDQKKNSLPKIRDIKKWDDI